MKAKEMFEKLNCNYIDKSNDENFKEIIIEDNTNNLIYEFYIEDKIFYITNANKNDISFELEQLKAIKQQIKELGWYE